MMKEKIKRIINTLPYVRTLKSNIDRLENTILYYKNEFETWVPPGHYYSPIPSVDEILEYKSIIYDNNKQIFGIDLNETLQKELLVSFSEFYKDLDFQKEPDNKNRYYFNNPSFREPDGIILYSFLRHFKPKRIIEIGSGYTSALMLDVNESYFNNELDLTFIEPYPELFLSLIKEKDKSTIKLLPDKIQDVNFKMFDALKDGDLLFIDSTHVSKTGSDVNVIFFEILPRIKPGVFIHFHDIVFPFEYPQDWVFNADGKWKGFSWNEAFILRSFLMYNGAFKMQFFTSYLLHKQSEYIKQFMPLLMEAIPGSIYLRKTE